MKEENGLQGLCCKKQERISKQDLNQSYADTELLFDLTPAVMKLPRPGFRELVLTLV